MKILVCIKQVPDTVEVKIDPKTGFFAVKLFKFFVYLYKHIACQVFDIMNVPNLSRYVTTNLIAIVEIHSFPVAQRVHRFSFPPLLFF